MNVISQQAFTMELPRDLYKAAIGVVLRDLAKIPDDLEVFASVIAASPVDPASARAWFRAVARAFAVQHDLQPLVQQIDQMIANDAAPAQAIAAQAVAAPACDVQVTQLFPYVPDLPEPR